MENYKCKKCSSFLACFNDNITTFKAKRGVNIENDKIILRCKCGHNTIISNKKLLGNDQVLSRYFIKII